MSNTIYIWYLGTWSKQKSYLNGNKSNLVSTWEVEEASPSPMTQASKDSKLWHVLWVLNIIITASVRVRTLREEVNIVRIYILLISCPFSSQAYSFLCRLTAKKEEEEEKQDPTTWLIVIHKSFNKKKVS